MTGNEKREKRSDQSSFYFMHFAFPVSLLSFTNTRNRLFEKAVAASAALHFFLLLLTRLHFTSTHVFVPVMQVDLSTPFRPRRPGDTRLPGAAKGTPAPAPKPTPGGQGPKQPATKVPPVVPIVPVPAPAPAVQEKPWVLPGPNTKVLEKPVISPPAPPPAPVGATPGATGVGGEGGRGGSGGGPGTGEAIVDRPPRLINVDEIRKSLRHNYPISERAAGREGTVVVQLSIGADGKVQDVQVAQSAGAAFDDAARAVAQKMIFEPALIRSIPTAVRVKQEIQFQIRN